MLLSLVVAATIAVTPSVDAALVFLEDHTAPRNATVDARGARVIRIHARAGWLKIRGQEGAANVEVRGTARASEEEWLDDIKLIAERKGDVVEIEVEMAERNYRDMDRGHRALDLDIAVPAGVALEVQDSSGDLEIRDVGALELSDSSGEIRLANIGGALEIEDSSGEMRIDGVRGDVRVRDSSGGIDIERITGSVDVVEDSSGEIDVRDVSGTVRVGRDSSGSINVDTVGGDFVVERDGSGDIDYRGVKGSVRVPGRRGR
jgi:DUF4097 and DUF4098 domain-containing protein YvlB